jgi:uncharacterized membrane protein
MSAYLVAKWIHILSSTLLFGTGIGSAFYMLFAGLNREPRIVWFVTRYVVIADWAFTTTAVIVQPLSGLYMMHLAKIPLTSRWIAWSFVLYFVAGACWLPVVWMQLRMREMARTAMEAGEPMPPEYARYLRVWVLLGIPAFFALAVVFYLMVAKPT